MSIVRSGLYSQSRGRSDVTAVKGNFEMLRVDEAFIGPQGPTLPTGNLIIGQEFWENTSDTLYKYNGTVWVPIGGSGAPNSQWTAFMVASDSPGGGSSGGEYGAQYNTIQSAIDAAAAVATSAHQRMVLLAPETYSENIVMRPNVTLRGATSQKSRPTIEGQIEFSGALGTLEIKGIDLVSNGGDDIFLIDATMFCFVRECNLNNAGNGTVLVNIVSSSGAGGVVFDDTTLIADAGDCLIVDAGAQTEVSFNRCTVLGPCTINETNIGFFAKGCRIDEHSGSAFAGDYEVDECRFFGGLNTFTPSSQTTIRNCSGSIDISGMSSSSIHGNRFEVFNFTVSVGSHEIADTRITRVTTTGANATTPTVSIDHCIVTERIAVSEGNMRIYQSTIDHIAGGGDTIVLEVNQTTLLQANATTSLVPLGVESNVLFSNCTWRCVDGPTQIDIDYAVSGPGDPGRVEFYGCSFQDCQAFIICDTADGRINWYNNYCRSTVGAFFNYDNGGSTGCTLRHAENVVNTPSPGPWAAVTGVQYVGSDFKRGFNVLVNSNTAITGTPFSGLFTNGQPLAGF